MEETKQYLVIVKLTDGTEYVQPREYNWSGWDSILDDDRKQFIQIGNIIYNKKCIKSIQIIDNPDYKELKLEEPEPEEA